MQPRQFLQGRRRWSGERSMAVRHAPSAAAQPPATSFPSSLDTLYGAREMFSTSGAEVSDQKFLMSVFAPGEVDAADSCSTPFRRECSKWVTFGRRGAPNDVSHRFGCTPDCRPGRRPERVVGEVPRSDNAPQQKAFTR